MSSCDFMPQVARDCLFWFYVLKIDIYTEIFALGSFISALLVRTNNLAIF